MKCILLIAIGVLMSSSGWAGGVWKGQNKLAIGGYDVVAYHTTNSATRGHKRFSLKHKGDMFYFSSAENRKLFKSNPNKFLPKYDGYCAFAVAKMNKKVPPNPETFKIYNGKLLLFYNDFWEGAPFNTIVPWNQNELAMYPMAEKNWKKLR